MPKQIVIAEQQRIAAVFSEDQIQELIVATGSHQVSDVYLGTVENVLPGIDAAFVNIGDSERNGFMHVTDLGPLRLKRSAGSITELLAPQQKVLVQIMKEPTGNKGPRLTGNITLPGRYLVLMPYGRGVNLSRRIESESERNRLRALAILVKPAGMGLLVRTEAEGISEDAIIEDLESLQRQWESVQQQAMTQRPPTLLNRDDDFVQRVLRDVYNADVNRIVTDSGQGLKRVKHHLSGWNGGKLPTGVLIDQHRERTPILEYFRVNAAIREALKPRVDLPSGGYVIIEPTEALTVIDVNSGSFTRSATARETVLWTNCEAATEIARQLRLRNIAGVIVVDFIDMDSRRDKMQVLEQFTKALRSDKARPQISQLSELGLVELTRKRQGQNLYELFGKPCPTCGGLGHLVHPPGEADPTSNVAVTPRSSNAGPSPLHTALPSAILDGQGSSLEPHQDLQELDLVNHPSYQDRSSGRGGNRRRRRRDSGPSRGNGSAQDAPTLVVKEPKETKDSAVAATSVAATPAAEDKRPSRSSRSRATGRTEGRPEKQQAAEPAPVVTVEMTAEEQRIYAMLGISPLVLANVDTTELKNPTVTVVLPGQRSPSPAPLPTLAVTPAVPKPVVKADSSVTPAKTDEPKGPEQEIGVAPAVVEGPPEGNDTAVTTSEPAVAATEPAAAEPVGTTRRRRRRSSAASRS